MSSNKTHVKSTHLKMKDRWIIFKSFVKAGTQVLLFYRQGVRESNIPLAKSFFYLDNPQCRSYSDWCYNYLRTLDQVQALNDYAEQLEKTPEVPYTPATGTVEPNPLESNTLLSYDHKGKKNWS